MKNQIIKMKNGRLAGSTGQLLVLEAESDAMVRCFVVATRVKANLEWFAVT